MAFVTNEENGVALAREAYGLEMDLGHERAGGVDGVEIALDGGAANGRRYAVRAVEHVGLGRNLIHVVDEHHAPMAETLHHRLIVHDLVIDVERRAEKLQGPLQALNRHIDARAEPARVRQNDSHGYPP